MQFRYSDAASGVQNKLSDAALEGQIILVMQLQIPELNFWMSDTAPKVR